MDWRLEVVVVPVSDVGRTMSEQFRVVQLTQPGSACSITIGVGLAPSEPGSL